MREKIFKNLSPQNMNKKNKSKYEIRLKLKNKQHIAHVSRGDDIRVSIITCTNRPRYLDNVFENYNRQSYKDKELIIILNNNKMNLKDLKLKAKEFPNVSIFQIDEKKSLGYCLNFGVNKANYGIIAKMDDDDYYGPNYLFQAVSALRYADVVGKYCTYVYFEDSKTLAIRNPKRENRYVYRLEGPTLVFRKEVFNKIKFHDKSLGEDIQFCRDCLKNGIKLYATDKNNYVYIRHSSKDKHTWNIRDELYKKLCKIIGEVDDYKSYIEKSKT